MRADRDDRAQMVRLGAKRSQFECGQGLHRESVT
jgi:hypothetical protein